MNRLFCILLKDIWQKLRGLSIFLVFLLIGNGLLEGLGITLLFPLLGEIGIGDPGKQTILTRFFDWFFQVLNIPRNPMVLLALIIGAFLIQYSVFLLQARFAADLQHRYTSIWRESLFADIMRARWSFFVSHKSGELVNTLISETNRISGAFYLTVQLVAAGVITLVYVLIAVLVAWKVTLALLFVGVVMFMLSRGLMNRGHRIGTEISRRSEDLQTSANEFLSGAKLVKASATEEIANERFSKIVSKLYKLYFWGSFHPNLTRAIFEFAAVCTLTATLVVGTQKLRIDPATILIVLALFLRLYPRLSTVQQNLQTLSIHLPAISTITETAERAALNAERVDMGPLPPQISGNAVDLKIDGLTVKYGEIKALSSVSLAFPSGSTVGIVGGSGAGKSTVADCLLGLIEPESGEITVNSISLRNLPLGSWRRHVGYVAQDTFLFNASILENIRWGNESASEDDITRAVTSSGLDEFIKSLPDGYHTVVGDRGVRLSGGQRQRIGLARALVNQVFLLILDEATSALDSESERYVLQAIEKLHGQMTIVTIAHRLSTVRNTDRIYVLESGRIVEDGNWDQLLKADTRFRYLWELQKNEAR
ncbi:MAG: ABC transporter ATP-binding protein [Syntrophobacterales bacterium]|jgi:ATP-binding cassette subfamily C protein